MREIKFRAWHKKQAKMHPVKELRWFDGGNMIDTIRIDEVEKSSPVKVTIASYLAPDDVELMQFTGLVDAKGKEIYEGDIVRSGFFALNDVTKFGDNAWNHLPEGVQENDITTVMETWAIGSGISDLGKIDDTIWSNPDIIGVEVIGNVYEHPELLAKPQ